MVLQAKGLMATEMGQGVLLALLGLIEFEFEGLEGGREAVV